MKTKFDNEQSNYFYKNLYDSIENLGDDPELEEYENFLVDGQELIPEAQLIREKNRILLNFTHLKGQTFDFIKHNAFRNLINEITLALENYNYDYDTMKKILVHLDLELGIEIMFTSSLSKMVENGLEDIKNYSDFETFDYQTLANYYNRGLNNKFLR